MEQAAPIDELSRSLMDFESRLSGLDEQGKAELLEELDDMGLTLEDVGRMVEGVK